MLTGPTQHGLEASTEPPPANCVGRGTLRRGWRRTSTEGAFLAGLILAAGAAVFPSEFAGDPHTANELSGVVHRPTLTGLGSIPAFSRKYRTACTTCHLAPGKLNAQGEAFRLYGYRFPIDDEGLRKDDPIPLGAEPWKEVWPEAIWPGELPEGLPISLHFANDVRLDRGSAVSFLFPQSVHLVSGTSLGQGIAAFVDVGWRRGGGISLEEAKVKLQDPLTFLPPRALNLWIGAQRPHLLTFGDPALDMASRQLFLWQTLRMSNLELENPLGGEPLVSENAFRWSAPRPMLELNGLARGRLYYALGLAQSSFRDDGGDGTRATDVFVKLRYKLGGIGLDGSLPAGIEPVAWGGQLMDAGVTLEQFAYFGKWPLEGGGEDTHRSFGTAIRALQDRWEVGIGHVWGRHSRPWARPDLTGRHSSFYARADYLVFPWVIGSLKADRTIVRALTGDAGQLWSRPFHRARIMPGAVLLLRQNVRVIAEGEFFLRDEPFSLSGGKSPHSVWLRLDLAF